MSREAAAALAGCMGLVGSLLGGAPGRKVVCDGSDSTGDAVADRPQVVIKSLALSCRLRSASAKTLPLGHGAQSLSPDRSLLSHHTQTMPHEEQSPGKAGSDRHEDAP